MSKELSKKTREDLSALAERLEDQAFSWDITEEALEITKGIVKDMRNLIYIPDTAETEKSESDN